MQAMTSEATKVCTALQQSTTSINAFYCEMNVMDYYKPSPMGPQYALTIMNFLINCVWSIPLVTKEEDEVMYVYLVNMYVKCGRLHKKDQTMDKSLKTLILLKWLLL